MFFFLRFKSQDDFNNFKNRIIAGSDPMPSLFSHHTKGMYSKFTRNLMTLMYADQNSYDSACSPSFCRFYGLIVRYSHKTFLIGFISIELWIVLPIIIWILHSIYLGDLVDLTIISVFISLILFWKRTSIAKIKQFIKKDQD
ncbi:MAG: hypothetical protein J1F23_00965 [Oscillospiraceae bacterium]|nr:hypothetical protein [Oscillospiraceae bacterium]